MLGPPGHRPPRRSMRLDYDCPSEALSRTPMIGWPRGRRSTPPRIPWSIATGATVGSGRGAREMLPTSSWQSGGCGFDPPLWNCDQSKPPPRNHRRCPSDPAARISALRPPTLHRLCDKKWGQWKEGQERHVHLPAVQGHGRRSPGGGSGGPVSQGSRDGRPPDTAPGTPGLGDKGYMCARRRDRGAPVGFVLGGKKRRWK